MATLVDQYQNPPPPDNARRLTRLQAAAYIGTKPKVLARLASLRRGPKYCRVGKKVYYRISEIETWLISLETKGETR